MSAAELKVYQLLERAAPPVVREALPPELFEACRLERVPVRVTPLENYSGMCHLVAEHDVVELDTAMLEGLELLPNAERRILRVREVYLHEVAHRLMLCRGHDHDGAFMATVLMLYLRSNQLADLPSKDMRWSIGVYDFQDEDQGEPGLAAVFEWAWAIGLKFANSDLTAAAAATEISRRYFAWRQELLEAPAKLAALERARQVDLALLRRQAGARPIWLAAGMVVGALAFSALWLLVRG